MRLPFIGNFPISQTFGNVFILNGVDVYAQFGLKGHNGIDYSIPNDTPLYAPHSGKILEATYDKTGYGWYLKIENDIEGSVLGHMRKFTVNVGCIVKEGDLIGYSDNSGFSTGPHLHHGYYRLPRNRKNGYNGFIDQTPYIVSVSIPNEPDTTNDDINMKISDFLKSVGYTYENTHLDVVKVMYESDKKLKSGDIISKTECEASKNELTNKFNKEKDELKQNYDKKLEEKDVSCKKTQEIEIAKALDNYKKEIKIDEINEKIKEYDELKLSKSYKIVTTINDLLKVLDLFKNKK